MGLNNNELMDLNDGDTIEPSENAAENVWIVKAEVVGGFILTGIVLCGLAGEAASDPEFAKWSFALTALGFGFIVTGIGCLVNFSSRNENSSSDREE